MTRSDSTAPPPLLSVIVVFHDMRREAPRTLHSLSRAYQRGIDDLDYEVIAVDSRSSSPLEAHEVEAFGPEFRYLRHETASVSPVEAINRAATLARGRFVTVCIDGARLLTPGVLKTTAMACRMSARPVIAVLGWHLGPKPQRLSMLEGYDRAVEDRLLADAKWQEDGYRLFDIACLAPSCADGVLMPFSESNCVTVSRAMFDELGGYDPAFTSAGGGFVNLDYWRRACALPGTVVFVLLGEGSFHQFHGGSATNSGPNRPLARYQEEYAAIRGEPYARPLVEPVYLGTLPSPSLRFLRHSLARREKLHAGPA